MIVDFLEDGADGEPMVRIFDFSETDIRFLVQCVSDAKDAERPILFELSDSKTLLQFNRMMLDNQSDAGAQVQEESFTWSLYPQQWSEVVELLKYFLVVSSTRNRFQWLSGPLSYVNPRGISVLLSESVEGHW